MLLSEMYRQRKAQEIELTEEQEKLADQDFENWKNMHDLRAEEQYRAMQKKYKLRTKYNLRTAKSIVDAVESGKIQIKDADFPYDSFAAFKKSISKIDYDNDEFGKAAPDIIGNMTARELLEFIEHGHRGITIDFLSYPNAESCFDEWKQNVLNGVYDD